MKQFIKLSIGVTAIALTLLIFKNQLFTNERDSYAAFLNEEYNQIPTTERPIENKEGKDGKQKFDNPQMAAWHDYFTMMDPEQKRVPMERMRTAHSYERAVSMQKDSEFDILEWERINSNMGGRTRTLMWDPNDPEIQKVWAGSVTGGLWYNNNITDDASEWQPVSDVWPNLTIGCMTYDPNNTETYYVGTGESPTAIITYRESSGVGVGIWKTEDAGETWELMPSTEGFKYINDIVVRDEAGVSVIYAAVVSGKYKGMDQQSAPTDGLYRSADNGETWEQVLPNITDLDIPYAPSDIEITANGRIFVGTGRNIEGNGAACILYSDAGTTGSWTLFDDYVETIENHASHYLPGRVMISSSQSNPNIIYSMIAAGYTSGFPYYHGRYILKSEDGGETWAEINKPNSGDWASLAWHAFVINVDPSDPDHVMIGGLDLYNTLDGGDNWYHVSDWAMMYYGGGDDYVHADNHVIKYRPGHPNEAVFGTDGGVFYTASSQNAQPVFEEKNNDYSTLQFYSCAIHPDPAVNTFAGGLQDNGSLYYQGEELDINDMLSGGDGAFTIWDKEDPDYFITSIYYNRYYVYENGSQVGYEGWESGTFVCPADLNSQTKSLFANAHGFFGEHADQVMRITNLTNSSWSNTSYQTMNTGTEVPFTALTVSPYSPENESIVYLGTQDGKLFMVEDMESIPYTTEIGSEEFPTANISCIAVGGSADTLLVSFSNFGVSSLWYTDNGGESWSEKEANLPDMPVRWIILHPESNKNVLIATESGVWMTSNLTSDETIWKPENNGLSNVRVDMLKLREEDMTVLAASHGRGLLTAVWEIEQIEVPSVYADETTIFPNPASNYVNYNTGNKEYETINIYDLNGKLVHTEKINNQPKGQIMLDQLSSGSYLVEFKNKTQHSQRKLIIK